MPGVPILVHSFSQSQVSSSIVQLSEAQSLLQYQTSSCTVHVPDLMSFCRILARFYSVADFKSAAE